MTDAWPFLIGRARVAGQRVVVAPEIVGDGPALAWLAGVARGPDTPAGAVVAHRSPDGALTALARVFPATHAHYGLPGEGPLRDRSGRPIRLTVGVVVRHDQSVTEADLAEARTATADAYRAFWAEDESYKPRRSTRVHLRGGPPLTALGDTPTPPVPDRPRPPTGQGWRRVLGGVIGALALALLVGVVSVVLSATGGGDRPETTTPAPTSVRGTATNPVTATPADCRRTSAC